MALPPPVKPEIKYTQLFINNEYIDSESGKTFATINPVTEEKICDVQEGDQADINKAVAAAKAAFDPSSPWRLLTPAKRGSLLLQLADLIERDHVFLASLESLDNGKPYAQALMVDMDASVKLLRYYAGYADKIHGQTMECESDLMVYTRREPVGVCGGIVPWNFPLLILIFKLAPALTCGNTIVIKPAEQTPLTAAHLGSLIVEAGFPPGVVNIIPGYGPTAGGALVSHPDVNKVTFTGSTEVGQLILQGSGKSNMKRITLECGGKSPLIIFPDANLDEALSTAHRAVFFNSGQVCIAGSRLYVHEDIYDEFVAKAVEAANKRKIGDPFDLKTESGPQVDKIQFDKIMELIEVGKSQGAKMLCGGGRQGDKGYFIENTLFVDVKPDMRILKEEIFGPVQCIVKFKTTEEVIKMANDTTYGLAAGLFTKNIDTYIRVSNALQAGTVWVNNYGTHRAYAPFGGYKMSGIGREFGKDGLKHYTETKTVMVKIGSTT